MPCIPLLTDMKKTISLFFAAICLTSISSAQPNMIRVKGGTFEMGDTAGDADEKPLHQVLITDFMLAATETTYQEFEAFVRTTGYVTDAERGEGSYIWDSLGWHIRLGVHWRHDALGRTIQNSNEYPVIHVSWNDATQYCNWLSEKQGLIKVYDFQFDSLVINLQANGYRLPTEAEWEYAAAGGATKKKGHFSGKGALGSLAWYAANTNHGPQKAAQKSPNALGISDLSGNVWEWCHDWYDKDSYKQHPNSNTFGSSTGKERSIRGGSWNNNARHCRVANRSSRFPDFRDGSIGFRVLKRI